MNLLKGFIMIIAGIFLLLSIIVIFIYFDNYVVEKDYFYVTGMTKGFLSSSLFNQKGKPIKEEVIPSESGDSFCIAFIYDGYEFLSEYQKYTDNTMFENYYIVSVFVTDPNYRIGKKGIGVGTTRKEVQRVYRFSTNITGITDENVIGFVDGNTWVEFYFNSDNRVEKIRLLPSIFAP